MHPDVRFLAPVKTAGVGSAALAALVGAVSSRVGTQIPIIENLRLTNPMVYAALIAATAVSATSALQGEQVTPQGEREQSPLVPGALVPPGFLV